MAQALAAKGVAKEMVQRILPMAEGSWEKALKSIGQLGSENPHEALWVNGLRAAISGKQNKGGTGIDGMGRNPCPTNTSPTIGFFTLWIRAHSPSRCFIILARRV